MKKILVPTDYSDTADNAFKYALNLANNQAAKLYVLHVYEPPVISGGIHPNLVTSVHEKYYRDELELIKRHQERLESIQKESGMENLSFVSIVNDGFLIDEILAAIDKHKIDYIVMGTDGQSSFQKKLLGTNTLKTIEAVKIPVLSVPKEARFKKIKTSIHLTGYLPEEEKIIDHLAQDAIERNIQIKCVHLLRESSDLAIYEKWKTKYEKYPMSFHNFEGSKSLAKSILSYVEKNPVDLISIMHRQRQFFERFFSNSLTLHLGKKLGVPLLVFHNLN